MAYDAFLLLSFGGPEGPDDVLPFLRNVTRGRGVPQERLAAVAEHYRHFGGVSPINAHCRQLLAAIGKELAGAGLNLPTYWGNRNWHPMLAETVAEMRDAGSNGPSPSSRARSGRTRRAGSTWTTSRQRDAPSAQALPRSTRSR